MAENRNALVVDDERDIRELLVMTLGRMGLRCDTASSLSDARNLLQRNQYDLCLTDMRLPDGSGIELVAEITARHPETPVAMITAYGNVEAAVDALKAGAFDFVNKPVDIHVLRRLVNQALDLGKRRRESPPGLARLQGDSPAMQALLEAHKGGIDAVFAHDDPMALGAIAAIEGAGLEPGRDIKVIGVGAVKAGFDPAVPGFSPSAGPTAARFATPTSRSPPTARSTPRRHAPPRGCRSRASGSRRPTSSGRP